jgi:hypothetical protein
MLQTQWFYDCGNMLALLCGVNLPEGVGSEGDAWLRRLLCEGLGIMMSTTPGSSRLRKLSDKRPWLLTASA